MTDKACGEWGGCPLPKGHNLGHIDTPSNHDIPHEVALEILAKYSGRASRIRAFAQWRRDQLKATADRFPARNTELLEAVAATLEEMSTQSGDLLLFEAAEFFRNVASGLPAEALGVTYPGVVRDNIIPMKRRN